MGGLSGLNEETGNHDVISGGQQGCFIPKPVNVDSAQMWSRTPRKPSRQISACHPAFPGGTISGVINGEGREGQCFWLAEGVAD